METETARVKRWDEAFWKEFSTMSDYFGPAIEPLQRKFGVGTKELVFHVGVFLGQRAAITMEEATPVEMLDKMVSVWNEYNLGKLQVVSKDPLSILISDCRICGQLPGTGEMYECGLHEGFFQGALSAKLGRPVSFRQETNYEGTAGTWCRRLVADISL
jgi:predicted hydrocarbon binding protein